MNYISVDGPGLQYACKEVANFLVTLTFYGYTVHPICDGIVRHRSKRASVKRIQEIEEKRFSCVALRFEAMRLSQQLTEELDPSKRGLGLGLGAFIFRTFDTSHPGRFRFMEVNSS